MDWPLALLSAIVGALAALWCPHPFSEKAQGTIRDEWDVSQHFGGISRWRPKTRGVRANGTELPAGCVVDQVHMMSRHAERYPTMRPGIRMLELYHKLQTANATLLAEDLFNASRTNFFAPFPAQQFEQLTSTGPFAGTLQAFSAGVALRSRYHDLRQYALAKGQTSFWASDAARCVDSAKYFAAGFFGVAWQDLATLHIVPETLARGGDTLTAGRACPNYRHSRRNERGHEYGHEQLRAFRSAYLAEISKRLRTSDDAGMTFDESEIYSMQEYCAFETLVTGSSPWCGLFTREEWQSFEYARDLLHYYRAGPGNPFAAPGGMLWLKATAELMSLGPEAGNLFFSFNHDGDVLNLLTALQLFPEPRPLPLDHVLHGRQWRMSDVVPMGARVVFERYVCPSEPAGCYTNPLYPNHEYCEEQMYEPHVRLRINDALLPIPRCEGPGRGCPLADFLELVHVRDRETADWAKICGVEEGLPTKISFLHHRRTAFPPHPTNPAGEPDAPSSFLSPSIAAGSGQTKASFANNHGLDQTLIVHHHPGLPGERTFLSRLHDIFYA